MRKIFVMGGGGFAMEPENLALDRYILSLSPKPRPRICFIGTASGDAQSYIDKFYAAYNTLECEPTHLSLFSPPTRDLATVVRGLDIVHVGGGNTRNLVALWKEWGLDRMLRDAYQTNGLVLSGISAGMLCWFEECVTDSYAVDTLDGLPALGWLKGSACPHFDGEGQRLPVYTRLLKEGMKSGLALDDGAGALFVNEELKECVSSRPAARALRFESGSAASQALAVRYLL